MLGFIRKKKTTLEKGCSYGVLTGDYIGEIFVYFSEDDDNFYFVSIPKMELRKVHRSKFDIGIKHKILDFINILPKDVYSVIEEHGKRQLHN